jgi:hypothetical protein
MIRDKEIHWQKIQYSISARNDFFGISSTKFIQLFRVWKTLKKR